jgi:import inner membrane translocase subunit TIM10
MIQSCYKKCIPAKYTDGELTKGESVCLDRCAAKYIEVSEKIGQQMQQMQQAGVPQ